MDHSNLRSYEDFQPETQLLKEEAEHIFRVKLPGFTKQQLRVQLDSNGNLKITGERPIFRNQWSRFRLDFRVPENSDANGIRAKFDSGILDLIIPYNKITPPTVVAAATPSASSPPPRPPPPPPIPAAKQPEPDEPGKQQLEAAALNNRQSSRADETSNNNNGTGGSSANKIGQPTPPTSTDGFPPPKVPNKNNNHNGGGSKDDKQQDSNIARRKKVESFGYDRRDEMETHDSRDEVLQESKFRSNNGYGRFGSTKTNVQRQMLIVNVVVAALVLVGLGMYVFFRNWDIKRTI